MLISLDTPLSTREKILRDKKTWKGTTPTKSFNLSVDNGTSKTMLKDICERLGITDFDNIIPCVDKIQTVVKLIPQMEQVCNYIVIPSLFAK